MKLKVLLPIEVLLEQTVSKITAEATNGWFTLLPRHIDLVTTLSPSIFTFTSEDGAEHFLAVDGGVLVKKGDRVYLSTTRAVQGSDLEELQVLVETELKNLDESQKKARSVMAKLEADTLRRFAQLGGDR
ncbi:MAG: F0F1 ATP synthase subunit epsilon [Firmicutes bacterium]|nr:F0F1 ATP synthase subunit epsilon [Bacillota bacterium]